MSLVMRTAAVWFVLMVAAILNGTLREAVLLRLLGEKTAHVVSTVLLCGIILAVAWYLLGWMRPAGTREAWLSGMMWLGLTVAFEFLAGHYLFGAPWAKLLADYNLAEGRIWILVLLTTLLAPPLIFQLRQR